MNALHAMNATVAPECNQQPVFGVCAPVLHRFTFSTLNLARVNARRHPSLRPPQGDAALEVPSPTVAPGARGAAFARDRIGLPEREGVGAR